MPLLDKQAISNYLRSDCRRRLRLDLSPDTQYRLPNGQTALRERQQAGMPPRSVSRLELQALGAAGQEWEEAKINDLVQTFGTSALVPTPRRTPTVPTASQTRRLRISLGRPRPAYFSFRQSSKWGCASRPHWRFNIWRARII
jgi:hypothetical protein